jgi:hypothetical protein
LKEDYHSSLLILKREDRMKPIEAKQFVHSLNYLFKETFEGSPPEGSIYLDRGIGVFNSIAEIDAFSASQAVSGSTIAAQTDHLRYYLEVLNNFLNGTAQTADWSKSWAIKEVSDVEWNKSKKDLRKTYNTVLITFGKIDDWDEDKISEAMAIVVHTAYHLGAIRQIAKGSQPIELAKVQ